MNTILLEVDELTNGLESENIPKLLQDKDILSLSKLEEGISGSGISGSGISGSGISGSSSENSNNSDVKKPKVNPVTILKNFLPEDDDNNYHSEDENYANRQYSFKRNLCI